jgi:hypothetical protein
MIIKGIRDKLLIINEVTISFYSMNVFMNRLPTLVPQIRPVFWESK